MQFTKAINKFFSINIQPELYIFSRKRESKHLYKNINNILKAKKKEKKLFSKKQIVLKMHN